MQSPLYVTGRVIGESGEPAQEPVSISLNCGMRSLQVIRTDTKGYFQFVLGAGPQGNVDLTAADQEPPSVGIGGMSFPSGFGAAGAMGGLTGCELRISVAGFQPLTSTITDPGELRTIDVGTLQLRRMAGATGSSISVTSMLVPKDARKEFDKGTEDIRNKKIPSATEHLEKAVADYDKYAAAWNELGTIYSSSNEPGKARDAFGKAIAADPHYIQPYVGLAVLSIETNDYQTAIDSAGKALEMDPKIGVAQYLLALGYFRLNRMDDAEKSALQAESGPHPNFPQVHAVLADIYVQKQDYAHAAAEMRAYLKEAPTGALAPELKKNLDEINKSAGGATTASSRPEIAP
jgi:Tfp pilus assembly protein PilF